MNATSAPNRFLAAPAGTIVRPRYAASDPVCVAPAGHFRSMPAEIEGTAVSSRFRLSKVSELPVRPAVTGQAIRPAAAPVDDPTLATAPRP
jgi:hypothetical protein